VYETVRTKACPNPACEDAGKVAAGNIILHGAFTKTTGASQRCLCKTCGTTFSGNTSTAYFGLRCSRDEFDQVMKMRVEGVSIAAIARIAGRARSTITRWIERASASAKSFNDGHLRDFELQELQADELCTFAGKKTETTWLFTTIEVSSRLWPAKVVGRRSYRNTELVFNKTVHRGKIGGPILVTSDGFEFYEKVVRNVLCFAAIHGQVIKTRRNNRVCRVQRTLKVGTASQLARALFESEDSETLNTSFVERLNLTIRQSLAYVRRRSPAHARNDRRLDEDLDLVQCYYNFVRRHLGLKFGQVCKTPAMQAGLAVRPLSFRDIFDAVVSSRPPAVVVSLAVQGIVSVSERSAPLLAA
jgi:transposase-like protein/IS1 family transposase